ncbi:MAG: preprotein translocase subunit YajC [Desulfobacterales bacterium]|nr:preprotein translocase subunit YajC [Desulfobacterales bacterium]
MTGIAYAMGTGGAAAGQGGGFGPFIPLILMFVIFYFLLIRPQQKRQKEHRELINNIKKDDKIVIGGGIHGIVTSLDETTVKVEIADKVQVKVNRASIAGLAEAPQAPAAGKKK